VKIPNMGPEKWALKTPAGDSSAREAHPATGSTSSITFHRKAGVYQKSVTVMNMQVVRWFLDLGMGIFFLVSFITGFFKFTLLMRIFGLTDVVLPLALMSDIHDWTGLALGFFVAAHLFVNRGWIKTMTRRILRIGKIIS